MANILKKRSTGGPAPDFPSLFNIPSLFNDWLVNDWFPRSSSDFNSGQLPAVNVRETDDSYELEVAAPGMRKEDFKVEMQNDRLVISGESKMQDQEGKEGDKYVRREFSYQSFMRTFTLPQAMVDGEKISAKYNDGVLCISVPKTEQAKPKSKTIPIS